MEIINVLKNAKQVREMHYKDYDFSTAFLYEKVDEDLWCIRYDCGEYEYLTTKELAEYIYKHRDNERVYFEFD